MRSSFMQQQQVRSSFMKQQQHYYYCCCCSMNGKITLLQKQQPPPIRQPIRQLRIQQPLQQTNNFQKQYFSHRHHYNRPFCTTNRRGFSSIVFVSSSLFYEQISSSSSPRTIRSQRTITPIQQHQPRMLLNNIVVPSSRQQYNNNNTFRFDSTIPRQYFFYHTSAITKKNQISNYKDDNRLDDKCKQQSSTDDTNKKQQQQQPLLLLLQEVERVEEDGRYYGTIRTIWLNNPAKYNTLSMELLTELSIILQDIQKDPDCRVVILGAVKDSKGFCAGHDLKEIIENDINKNQELFRLCSEVMMQLQYQLPQPILCQVSGIVTAAGCQLVSSCDIVIAHDIPNTQFAVSGINIGLFCSTPAVALSRSIPSKKALELLLTGTNLSATEAYQLGLVNHLVSSYDELQTKTNEIARTITKKSPYAIQRGKEMFYHQLQISNIKEAYEYATERIVTDIQSEDAKNGIESFLMKRKEKPQR